VMQRPGEEFTHHYPDRVTTDPASLHGAPGGRILFQPVTQLGISATGIRSLLGQGQDPRYLLPDAVLHLIRREKLYR